MDSKKINEGTYNGCTSIAEVVIPTGIEIIEYQAFSNCTSIRKITISNSVGKIYSSAFSNCTNLKDVEIPCDIKTGSDVFYNCSNLENILIKAGNTFSMRNVQTSGSYSIDTNEATLYSGMPWYYAKSGVVVEIENGVGNIGNYEFYSSSRLGTVIIPTTVTNIGNYAFYNCSNLSTINYRGSSTAWNSITKGSNNDKLSSVTINYNYND